MAEVCGRINTWLANENSPLRVKIPDCPYEQTFRDLGEKGDNKNGPLYRCLEVVGHHPLPGLDACKEIYEITVANGFKIYSNWGAPWKKGCCEGPGDVFDPWPWVRLWVGRGVRLGSENLSGVACGAGGAGAGGAWAQAWAQVGGPTWGPPMKKLGANS